MKWFCVILLIVLTNTTLYCQSDLTVIKLNDFSFGTDFGGKEKRLDHSDIGAAKFQIQSTKDTDILITIILPDFFLSADGLSRLPASYNERSAAWSLVDNISSRTTFDPRQQLQLSIKQNQTIYIWIGGSLHPSAAQRVGKYSGNITLTVQTLTRN